jgi:lipooligosaccharide transport system ATP-binding protein
VLEIRVSDAVRGTLNGRLDAIADRVEELPDRLLLYVGDGERALETVHQRQIPLESALVRRATLEDVFLRLTGRSLIE